MVLITAISSVGKMISAYTGYRKDKIKEDDNLVRKRLITEVDKSIENIRNILETLYENKDTQSINALKKVKDELDIFSNDITMSVSGHQYGFFSTQRVRSPSEGDLKTLVGFDLNILENIINVTEATRVIETMILDGDNIDTTKELKKLRQYITGSRNSYKDRENFLRGWK